jgi:hypothetical protein
MQADLYKALNDKKLNCPVFQSPEKIFIFDSKDTAFRNPLQESKTAFT